MPFHEIRDSSSFWKWQEVDRLEVVIIGKVPVWEWVEGRAMSNSKKPKVAGYLISPQETRYPGLYHSNLKFAALEVDNFTDLIHHRNSAFPRTRL